MFKKGDTLIEVTIAVGIFSMIAIAISAVMSAGTSSAQTALETTITREEIDTQAEALRFIHSSYIADQKSNDEKFKNLWQTITDNALTIDPIPANNDDLLNFVPDNCNNLYTGVSPAVFTQNAFVINPRKLGDFTDTSEVYISANNNQGKFMPASTYPRLVYGVNNQTEEGSLVENQTYSDLFRAEGLYVIAVKDFNTTNIVDEVPNSKTSAFYDFYIRTCWYGFNADLPSTISTVIRLYDPDIIKPATE